MLISECRALNQLDIPCWTDEIGAFRGDRVPVPLKHLQAMSRLFDVTVDKWRYLNDNIFFARSYSTTIERMRADMMNTQDSESCKSLECGSSVHDGGESVEVTPLQEVYLYDNLSWVTGASVLLQHRTLTSIPIDGAAMND
jgi:hypothetical protein